MIPSMMVGGGFRSSSFRWQGRPEPKEEPEEEASVDSRDDASDEAAGRQGGRFPRSSTMAVDHHHNHHQRNLERRSSRSAVEAIELKCERDQEAALQDLLGLRVSGSRSVGVFVQSVHAGSVVDLDGRIEVGDQLLNVESISLIGMTPDQAVRVLRAAFSFSRASVRITVAHHWADKAERTARPPSVSMSMSRSEGALADPRSNHHHHDESITAESHEDSNLLSAPARFGASIRRPRSPVPLPLPGVLSSTTTPVEIHHQLDKGPMRNLTRPHTQGAAKVHRGNRQASSTEKTATTGGTENAPPPRYDLEVDDEPATMTNLTPSSVSPSLGSASRFDSVLGMYDSNSEKLDTVAPTLPPRPLTMTSRRKTAGDNNNPRRKSSLPFPSIVPESTHDPRDNFDLVGAQSIDRGHNHPHGLPGSLINPTLRHRRVSHQSSDGLQPGSAGSGKTIDSGTSRSTGITELSRRFSPKHGGGGGASGTGGQQQQRAWGSDESLHLPTLEEEDRFNLGKPPRSLHTDDIKHFITNAQRKSIRPMKEKATNEELPLVSFDQLNQTSPSPTETNRRGIQSGSSGQSKSSKGSQSSQGSQKLSWQCPVCLDGASRIRRTKRRMMSTACGHVFCSSCVEDVVGKYHLCPTCRAAIKSMNDVHPIFM